MWSRAACTAPTQLAARPRRAPSSKSLELYMTQGRNLHNPHRRPRPVRKGTVCIIGPIQKTIERRMQTTTMLTPRSATMLSC
jgi:hypothetical protein